MNIKGGMYRIALVIAIVAIVPGALLGGAFFYEIFRTETSEHKAWQKKVEEWYQANPDWDQGYTTLWEPWESGANYYPPEEWREPRPIYKYPPIWQCVVGSIVAVPLSFFVVFFGIQGTTRLVIWVVAGFRDKGE